VVYPSGQPRPLASSLNFVAKQSVPNMVLVPLGPGNTITFYADSAGAADIIADVLGCFR
jgi:hypothetical protein